VCVENYGRGDETVSALPNANAQRRQRIPESMRGGARGIVMVWKEDSRHTAQLMGSVGRGLVSTER